MDEIQTQVDSPITEPAALNEKTDEQLDALISGDNQPEQEQIEPTPQQESEDTQSTAAAEQPQANNPDEEIKMSQERWQAVQKRLQDMRSFIGQRSTEIGNLRKQLEERDSQLRSLIEEKMIEAPSQALDLQDELRDVKEQKGSLEQEQAVLQARYQNQHQFFQFVHPDDADIDGMAQVLEADKIPGEFIARFKADPFGSGATAGELVQLAKRAKAERLLGQVIAYAKGLVAKNQSLEKQPSQVISKLQRTLSKPQMMSASDGGQAIINPQKSLNPANMSDAELDNFLNSMR